MIETKCHIINKEAVYNDYSQRNDTHYELKARTSEGYDLFLKVIDYSGYGSKVVNNWNVGDYVSMSLNL